MNSKRKYITGMVFTAIMSVALMTGCEKDGPVEDAGETIDEAAKDAGREIEDAMD